MRYFVLFALIIVFSVGAIAPTAFAFECDMMKKGHAPTEMVMDGNMPCHDKVDQQEQNQSHCDGLCLCLHLLVNQAQVFPVSIIVPEFFVMKDVFAFHDDVALSTSSAPPFKPPIFSS